MTNQTPLVALVHASPASIEPAKAAFAGEFPEAQLWHLLDDRLVKDADAAGGLTPPLQQRMATLIGYACDNGADAVQLSCSMYGPVAQAAEQRIPVVPSDDATFRTVATSGYANVVVLASLSSAAADTKQRLEEHLAKAGSRATVRVAVVEGAAAAAAAEDLPELERLVVAKAKELSREADAVVLAQFSITPAAVAAEAAAGVPVLSPPHVAARSLREQLLGAEVTR